jgi:hypothetical protein
VKVNAVFFRVINPTKAVVEVNDFLCATSQKAQTLAMALIISRGNSTWISSMDDLGPLLALGLGLLPCWAEREKLNKHLQGINHGHFDSPETSMLVQETGSCWQKGT